MPIALVLALVGLIAGVLSGMFGIGGGVVIVPALVALLGFTLTQANGTSLAVLLLPVGIFAVIQYYRQGKLKPLTAALVAVGLVLGGYFGARIALSLPPEQLQRAYGVFLLFAGWRFIEPLKWIDQLRGRSPRPPDVIPSDLVITPTLGVALVIVGLTAGIASGMFGIGGGIVIVPALVGLLRFDQKVAVGTSLGALLLPVSLPGVLAYYQQGELDLGVAAAVAVGLVFGAFIGARIALGLPSITVKRLYGIFLIVVGVRFIFTA